MATEGSDVVLFLTRDKLYTYFGDGILVLDIPPNLVTDLDIKDKDGLINLVTNFFKTNNILPAEVFFVLSESVCFSKDFPIKDPTDTSKVDEEAQIFLDAIPFNYTVSKIYKTVNMERAVGANQDFVDAIVDALTSMGFGLTALVPANIYPGFGLNMELTSEFAKKIIEDKALSLSSNMVGAASTGAHELAVTKPQIKKTNLRLFILIGVFVLLILTFVVLMLIRK